MNEIIVKEKLQTPIEIAIGVDEDGKTTARKLYKFLELNASHFSRWAKTNITENPFAEKGVDYEGFDINVEGNETVDYYLSATFAKKLSMQGKTERAEQARDYFIAVEDKLKDFARPHNVKQLAITSREICKIVGKSLQSHGVILREIRDCIIELQEMGFNTLEFFQESQYLAGNNEHRPQFIVTERGCEFYSRRLEPEERQIFIAEFKDRFQRMQDVLDGKPVKPASREPSTAVVSGAGTADIKLFSNGKTGLVVAGDKFYTIAADRLPFIEKAVTELIQSNVPRMDEIINSMFSASCKQWDYELVTSYSYAERTETPQIGQIERKGINNPRQGKTPEIEQIDLNSVVTLTKEQAKARYNMGTANLRNLAEQIGALVCSGTSRKRILYNRKKLDEYFNNM